MKLSDFFEEHRKVAVAFSGGVDSAYLLYAGIQSGAEVQAYYVQSAFQPRFELEDAKRITDQLRINLNVLPLNVLQCDQIMSNPGDRCYHCKKMIFSTIMEQARTDGYSVVVDGTNASDDAEDRPGMRALAELSVRSPLRECDLTKEEIRARSKEAGLFTWEKPSYACLATRIPTGEQIMKEKLERTERAEDFLMSLGFTDLRVRMQGDTAKIQVPAAQLSSLIEHRWKILQELKQYYPSVMIDLEGRKESN